MELNIDQFLVQLVRENKNYGRVAVEGKEKRQTIRMLLLGGVTIVFIIILFGYKVLNSKSYKNKAVERGETIYLNEKKYSYGSPDENYTISNVLICVMDSGKKIYEIKEYPNHEYIAVYCEWDGSIYKKE